MELSVALGLIEQGVDKTFAPQVWADLGAGKGLFTRALTSLLPEGSTVYALDKVASALAEVEPSSPLVTLKKIQTDFVREEIASELLDGILMANAFHFVENKIAFMKKVRKKLKPSGRMLIVEYDLHAANAWVPYPVHFSALEKLAKDSGFISTIKLGETASLYNRANIYSALLLVS